MKTCVIYLGQDFNRFFNRVQNIFGSINIESNGKNTFCFKNRMITQEEHDVLLDKQIVGDSDLLIFHINEFIYEKLLREDVHGILTLVLSDYESSN